jgi:hypothetical protein
MRGRALTAFAAGVLLASCQSAPQEPASVLNCDNGDTVEVGYSGQYAMVTYKNVTHRMRLALSRTGARYVGDGLQWQTQGMGKGTMTPLARNDGGPPPVSVTCKAGPPKK